MNKALITLILIFVSGCKCGVKVTIPENKQVQELLESGVEFHVTGLPDWTFPICPVMDDAGRGE
jgi:hypothetical protein